MNWSLFSGVWGKGAFMWLAVKSIKSQCQCGDLECEESCSILVISKLHRPLLTLLIRSLGKSHSGCNIFFFLFSCLSPFAIPDALYGEPLCYTSKFSVSSCAFKVEQEKGAGSQLMRRGLRAYLTGAVDTWRMCPKILCLKNLLYCPSFNAAGVCRDQGIIFDTCRKELCLHWFSILHY